MTGAAARSLGLYALVVFAGAWLVFWVQPLSARGLLSVLGGSAMVWSVAMVFFQAMLLAGYLVAHLLVRARARWVEVAGVAALWAGVALSQPVASLRPLGDAPGAVAPSLWLLATLAVSVGPSLLAVSTLAPLVSAWLARAGTRWSRDPYLLYAASNAGSIGALLAYPFVLEPLAALDAQAALWSVAALCLAPALLVLWWRARGGQASAEPVFSAVPQSGRALRVVALSAAPSALLVAVTGYLTTDVAAVPLLWVAPLALYLATFVVAFSRAIDAPAGRRVARAVLAFAPLAGAVAVLGYPVGHLHVALAALHLLLLSVLALACHLALARLRPAPDRLTGFYLLVSAGGLSGGVLAALAAPAVLDRVLEYPLAAVAAVCLLPARPAPAWGVWRVRAFAGVGLALIVAGVGTSVAERGWGGAAPEGTGAGLGLFLSGVAVLAVLSAAMLRTRPALIGGVLGVILAIAVFALGGPDVIVRERTFYGVYTVSESEGERRLLHGTTLHGSELRAADGTVSSLSGYYGRGSPFDTVISSVQRNTPSASIGLIGLGSGSLLCYSRPADRVRIYELDPGVVRLARAYFSALGRCAAGAEIVVGDGRLSVEAEAGAVLHDVLVMDAFSSGAIPVHMLTVEAVRAYLRVLAPDGYLVAHLSNRYLDLGPLGEALARATDLASCLIDYLPQEGGGALAADVLVLARSQAAIDALGATCVSSGRTVRAWTDGHASLLPVLRIGDGALW